MANPSKKRVAISDVEIEHIARDLTMIICRKLFSAMVLEEVNKRSGISKDFTSLSGEEQFHLLQDHIVRVLQKARQIAKQRVEIPRGEKKH